MCIRDSPYTGYIFFKWTGEIVGGTSYSNPEWVKDMTEHRLVTVHFRDAAIPPECSIDADCPEGEVCENGVCVPEEEPPDEKEFPWLPTALIVGGVAVAIAAATMIKKKKA